jgi:hypothetical protein
MSIRNSGSFLPSFNLATNQRGFAPRPAQVSPGLRFLQDTDNVGGIGEVAETQKKRDSLPVRIVIEMIYAASIER